MDPKDFGFLFDPNSKQGLQFLAAAFVLGCWYFFFRLILFPLMGQLNLVWSSPLELNWSNGLLLAIVVSIVEVLFFSEDPLYYGNPRRNKYVAAFQNALPANGIARDYKIEKIKDAKALWFMEFNKWSQPSHDMHQQWKRSFQRGFSCRLVYYILRTSMFFFWATVCIMSLCIALNFIPQLNIKISVLHVLPNQILFLIIMGFLWIRVYWKNNPTKPSGVWERYQEINELNLVSYKKIHEKT